MPRKKPAVVQLSDHKKPVVMGRPPIPAEERRTNIIKVLTSEAEQQDLQRAADAAGAPISTWVRMAALEKARGGPGTV